MSSNSFKNYFSEVCHYDEGYGYVTDARDEREAIDKIVANIDCIWFNEDMKQRLKREIRENMKRCWVRWQGWQDEDGQFFNCWVVTGTGMWGKKRYFMVYSSDWNRHYVEFGHRFEPKADEPGNRVHYSYDRCDVCNQMNNFKEIVSKFTDKEAHKLLLEMGKKFSVQSFVETHDSSYSAWPCPICDRERYKKEGWEGISYI